MKFHVSTTEAAKFEGDLLMVPVFEGDVYPIKGLEKLEEDIRFSARKEDFEGKKGQQLLLYSQGKIGSYKILLFGLGKTLTLTNYRLRSLIAKASKLALVQKAVLVGLFVPPELFSIFSPSLTGQAVVESIELGTYRFLVYKSEEEKKKERDIEDVYILASPPKIAGLEEGAGRGEIFSRATMKARDLINEPSSLTTPSFLATEAIKVAKESKGTVKTTVYGYPEIKKMKLEAFLGVSRGSDEEPKFIVLHYKGGGRPTKKIVIAGKGITFDTGGLSLKSSEHMETMKMDMSGAAAVLGVFSALQYFQPSIEVIGLIAACENMPSGKALKPGDILKAANGKTIEVLNTDAEGRLTLADALSYGVNLKPDVIVDLATLTGACMVALGQEIAGLWGNDEKVMASIKRSAERAGEKIWEMPLEEEYKDLIKSSVADLKNIQTGRYGGAITAALFLSEFVGRTPWVHLDIAGPAFEEKDTSLVPKGGAGFGVRTLLEYLLTF